MPITITEALAEIKTIQKRIEKKRDWVQAYFARQDGAKDPLEKSGGSEKVLNEEFQSIRDLETRIIALRRGIELANQSTTILVGQTQKTISDWLTWRREVAPKQREFLARARQLITSLREQAKRQGTNLYPKGAEAEKPQDFVMNIDEKAMAAEAERLEEILGTLDGQLSLKNATVPIVEI